MDTALRADELTLVKEDLAYCRNALDKETTRRLDRDAENADLRAEIESLKATQIDEFRDLWNHIDYAPRDRVIFACDKVRGYTSKVIWNGSEWECVNFEDKTMGIGFYPTHWHLMWELPK